MGEAILMNGGFFVHRDLLLDAPLFRCIKLQHVQDLFFNVHLYFRNATKWEDTWEIPSQFFELQDRNGPSFVINDANRVSANLFGSCWTDNIDSDALWRIYSGEKKDGVCIQTTIRKLFQSIDFSFQSGSFTDGCIAPVRYENLSTTPSGQVFFDDDSECYPRNMVPAFVKRNAFAHEREIRFLIHTANTEDHYRNHRLIITDDRSGLYLPFKNLDFVERLILDPRLSQDEFTALQNNLACHGKEIVKSTLYDTPNEIYKILLNSGYSGHGVLKGAKWWMGTDFVQR